MPKLYGTRKDKAKELMRLLNKGPDFDNEEERKAVKRWLDTWVTPLVEELVPELKEKRGGK